MIFDGYHSFLVGYCWAVGFWWIVKWIIRSKETYWWEIESKCSDDDRFP